MGEHPSPSTTENNCLNCSVEAVNMTPGWDPRGVSLGLGREGMEGRGSMFTRCCCLYQVAHRPFSGAAMLGFVRILLLPLPTLRSCVQLMQMHMVSTVHSYCQLRVDLLWCMCCRFLCLGLYGAFHCA